MYFSLMDHTYLLNLLRELCLFAMKVSMEQCVMTTGMSLRPQLSVDNLDMSKVSIHTVDGKQENSSHPSMSLIRLQSPCANIWIWGFSWPDCPG